MGCSIRVGDALQAGVRLWLIRFFGHSHALLTSTYAAGYILVSGVNLHSVFNPTLVEAWHVSTDAFKSTKRDYPSVSGGEQKNN